MSSTPASEQELLHAVQEYQSALEAGQVPDRPALLRKYPHLAGELRPYLDTLDALHAAAARTASTPDLKQGVPLGDFHLLREIARGGMGVVYEAVQLSLGRHVALKVLPFAAALDARQLQRFKNEAQAAANLHHSHIVPVFAVGCERGVHFYAMQLIDGRSLADLIGGVVSTRSEELSFVRPAAPTMAVGDTLAASLGKGLDFYRNAARLMKQAAEALEYAHQQGVVHRDIKPGNLLLDVRGHLWITDFGLAQVQASAELTRTGDLVGTLRYMSPEQASGQKVLLDHRTDIYSLGATFYELLARRPLFDGANRAILRHVVTDEPRSLRSQVKDVPFELETIVLKCLSKQPSERYLTAHDLADDLDRYLSHRPIQARRPGVMERCRKWAIRHPGGVIAVLLLLALTLVGLGINHALVTREQARTARALERERERAEQAERHLKQARELADLLMEIGAEELDDWFPMQGLRRRLLETALSHYQQMIDESGDEEATADLEATRNRVQRILADLATTQEAERVMLLGNRSVQDELGLSATQRVGVEKLSSRLHRERFRPNPDKTGVSRRKQLLELAQTSEREAATLLRPVQRKRLKQVALQMKGSQAFREAEVVSGLQLTAGQRQRMREIEEELLGPPSPWRLFSSKQGEALTRCVALLTPAQKNKWNELTGKKFEFRFDPFSFGRTPPPGGKKPPLPPGGKKPPPF